MESIGLAVSIWDGYDFNLGRKKSLSLLDKPVLHLTGVYHQYLPIPRGPFQEDSVEHVVVAVMSSLLVGEFIQRLARILDLNENSPISADCVELSWLSKGNATPLELLVEFFLELLPHLSLVATPLLFPYRFSLLELLYVDWHSMARAEEALGSL